MSTKTSKTKSDYMDIQEAADELGLCYNFVYERVHKGIIPKSRFGRRIKIKRKDFEAYKKQIDMKG